jgi:hypothetical protein
MAGERAFTLSIFSPDEMPAVLGVTVQSGGKLQAAGFTLKPGDNFSQVAAVRYP